MTNRFSNGMYKGPSKKQDAIAQVIFQSFHALGQKVTLSTNFFNSSGEVIYTYELDDVSILVLCISYKGEFIDLTKDQEEDYSAYDFNSGGLHSNR